MHPRSIRLVGPLVFAILLVVSLSSCATTPTGPVLVLPNSYYLKPDKGAQTELVKRGGSQVLPSPVAAYAVYGNIVAGALGKAPSWTPRFTDDRPFKGGADTRYFILETLSGKLESNLSQDEWHKRLQALGVPSDFEIYPAPPWTTWQTGAGG